VAALCAAGLALLSAAWAEADGDGTGAGNAPPLLRYDGITLDAQAADALSRHRAWLRDRRRRPPALHVPSTRPLAYQGDLEVLSTKGAISFDTAAGTYSSTTTLSVKAQTALSDVYLYMPELSSGTAAVSDGVGQLPTLNQGYNITSVALRQQLAAGDTLTLVVSQSGTPKCQSSFLSIVTCQIKPGMVFSLGGWRPVVYDPSAGRLLTAKTCTLEVKVPSTMTVGATGFGGSIFKQNPDGTKTYTFAKTDDDDFSFGAAPYVTGTLAFAGGKTTTTTYLLSKNATGGEAWRKAVADVMTFHAARYGPYDLPKIDVVEVPDITGAAFGPMTAVFMPSTTLYYPPTHWSTTVTLAHELGHQWFAGLIESWDNLSPWLNEGFAVFAEMEYTSDKATKEYGWDFRSYYRGQASQAYIYTVNELGVDVPMSSQKLYQAPAELYVAVTYDKGGMAVHMLRYLLGGDSPFFAALKAYRADHEGTGADVKSLQASLEKASGKELTRFFNKYVFSTGYPTYSVQVKRSGTSAEIVATADEDFGMPVELEIASADGKTERVKVPVSAAEPGVFRHTAKAGAEVLSVRFDPDRQILCRSLGKLPGDIHLNGEVDGIDLIYAAMVQGKHYDPDKNWSHQGFADWADLVFDGDIDQKDLDVVLKSFGKREGE
jgi:hypothetical protein